MSIAYQSDQGIATLTFDRPAKKNAITGEMYEQFVASLKQASGDPAVRAIVIAGAGGTFTAGNDLKDFQDNPPGEGSPQARLTDALIAFGKPLVAAVHGVAVGGGTTMLTHCDFVYAADSTRFQIPFINLALTPEFGSSYAIPARAGYLRAAELFMLGEPFTAAHAAELGLVTRVVPDPEVLAAAAATAQKLAAKPAGALATHKRLLKRSALAPLRDVVAAEGGEFAERVRSAEAREAFAAFFEKRPPDFRKAG